MWKAEVTAFLSLMFVLLISFVLGIIQISVIKTYKNLSRLTVDRALFSVFGEYEKCLLEQYHIFSIEGSYGTGEFNEERLTGRLYYYGTSGMEHEITSIQLLTDNQGHAFREQVLQYMEDSFGISIIRNYKGMTSEWEQQCIGGSQMEDKEKSLIDEYENLISPGNEEETSVEIEENPFNCVEKIENEGLLSLVLPDGMDLPGKSIDLKNQASERNLMTGRGTLPARTQTDGVEEKLLYSEYILRSFSNAVSLYKNDSEDESPDTGKSDNKNKSLDYEIEYILSGKKSDKENLESVLFKIFLIRMFLNYAYILTDSEKQSEASFLATVITALLLIPEASEAMKQMILLAWSAGESVIDIRSLLSGNKTALIKTSENWQLPLSSLFLVGTGMDHTEAMNVENGISYQDYLRAFLFISDTDLVTMRTIDRIEENLRYVHGHSYFRSDNCITKVKINNTAAMFENITYTFPVYFGYE